LQEWTLQEQFYREIISQPRGTIGTIQIHTGDRRLILALALYAVRTYITMVMHARLSVEEMAFVH